MIITISNQSVYDIRRELHLYEKLGWLTINSQMIEKYISSSQIICPLLRFQVFKGTIWLLLKTFEFPITSLTFLHQMRLQIIQCIISQKREGIKGIFKSDLKIGQTFWTYKSQKSK